VFLNTQIVNQTTFTVSQCNHRNKITIYLHKKHNLFTSADKNDVI